jgi:hypothetical protein
MSDVIPAKPEKPGPPVAAGKECRLVGGRKSRKSFKGWKGDYRDKARKVLARYRDERKEEATASASASTSSSRTPRRWARPSTRQAPVPDIRRRFQDKDDGRPGLTATILQRATQYSCESYDFDGCSSGASDDYLLPGFAVASRAVFNKPYLIESPAGRAELPELIYQEVGSDYVPWDRFAMSRSRIYERVWWAAVADDLTKDEVKASSATFRRRAQLLRPARRQGRRREGARRPPHLGSLVQARPRALLRGRGLCRLGEGAGGRSAAPGELLPVAEADLVHRDQRIAGADPGVPASTRTRRSSWTT